ncbi:MAG TPA: phosphotransferase [Candidatus Acidoferrales bacterium]|jgi:sugar (pentulose or hexulose) kinase/aminoglycoside phosphotransferase (APT) family kinase protein|nr:phosphotransferase [Candidatus Acidoferrales bacterium]
MADFIAIDVGSSFIKAAILDLDGLELRHTLRVPFPAFVPGLPPLHREVAPAAILSAVEDLLAGALPHAPRCDGLVVCGQMQGFVLVDGRGEPVSNYISWLDQRVTPAEFDEFATHVTPQHRRELGNEFRPGIALPLLYWLRRHGALPTGVPTGEATPVSIADFVVSRLSNAPAVMNPTQASAFGALRIADMCWHEEVIGRLGLDSLRWPEVVPTGSLAGTWHGVPCYASVGDQQCAIAGALLDDDELSVNIGTGSQLSLIQGTPIDDGPASTPLQLRPYFDGRFLRTITHIPGGRALAALVGLLTELGGASEEESWRRIEPAVAAVTATDLRANTAFFPGPCGHGGALENLHEGNMTAGHVFRAVFESMARNYEICGRRLDPEGVATHAVFSGGVARRLPILRELTAAELGMGYRLSPHPEDTLFGLMVVALAFRHGTSVCEATEDVRASQPTQARRPELRLTADNASGYLVARDVPRPREVRELGGGVSNTVLLVDLGGLRLVLKQSLHKLRVEQDWFSDPDRIFRESAALIRLAPHLPSGSLPEVCFEDHVNRVFAMTAAPPEAETWKTLLLRGEVSTAIAATIGGLLAAIWRASWRPSSGNSEWEAEFGDQTVFRELRLDPYYRATALRHPDLASRIESLMHESAARRLALVHGDWSPKNFLIAGGSVMAIDFEVIHFGDPSFDTAFLVNHLVLKSFLQPGNRAAYQAAAVCFFDAARQGLPQPGLPRPGLPEADARYGAAWLEPATLAHLGALMLARVDGKSPAEYLDTGLQARVRSLARDLILCPPATIEEVFARI